jgi:hypothetical protein
MKRLIFALIVLTIMLPMTTAMARNPGHGRGWYERDRYSQDSYNESYAALKLGLFMPNENADYLDNGFSVGGALGHKLNRNFALEIGLDNTSTKFDEKYVYEDIDVITLGIPVTAKFVVPLSQHAELFVGAGFGVYFTSIDDHEYADEYDNVDDASLGFHSLIGADIRMNPDMAFTMELRHTEIEQDFEEYYYDDIELGGTTASFGIKFLF